MSGPVNGLLEVAVVKDDVGALAAKFKSDILQIGLGRGLHDLATDEGGACECNLREIRR